MKLIVYDSWAQSWARLLFLESRILHSPPWMEQKFLFRVWYVNFYRISKEAKMKTYSSIRNDFQYCMRSFIGHFIFCEIHNRATHICFRYPCASWPYHDVIGMRDSKFCVCFYYFNKTLFTCADILPIRSKFDIHIMSFPKINCLGDFSCWVMK